MEINKKLLSQKISIAKKMVANMCNFEDKNAIGRIENFNQEICLVVAKFECQNPKCKSTHQLQGHHLIMRQAKHFMDFFRYASQRYYWANHIILCKKCHIKYHKLMGTGGPRVTSTQIDYISPKKIKSIKNKYKMKAALL